MDQQRPVAEIFALPARRVDEARRIVRQLPAPFIGDETPLEIAGQQQRQRPIPMKFRRPIPRRLGPGEMSESLVEFAEVAQAASEVVMRLTTPRIERERAAVPRACFLQQPDPSHRPASRVTNAGAARPPKTGTT